MKTTKNKGKECKTCDYKNAKRFGRADYRCPNCGRQLMLEMVLMKDLAPKKKPK